MQQCTAKISVVIPTHNRPTMLAEALASVACQTVDNWEVVVVDDGSTPPVNLVGLCDRFGPRVRGIRHESARGGASAKNTGTLTSLGQVIAFLDDDDLYAPTYLARALDVLDRIPELDVVFMGVSWFGSAADWADGAYQRAMMNALGLAKGIEIEPGLIRFGPELFGTLLSTVPMAFQRPVVRRKAFERIGDYAANCLLWDCDWAIRAALRTRTALITDGLYRQRIDGQGTSSRSDRTLDHLLSGVAIKEDLLNQADAQQLLDDQRRAVKRAAADGWFSLAYFYATQKNDCRNAFSAWLKSQRHSVVLRRYKFLLRVVACSLRQVVSRVS